MMARGFFTRNDNERAETMSGQPGLRVLGGSLASQSSVMKERITMTYCVVRRAKATALTTVFVLLMLVVPIRGQTNLLTNGDFQGGGGNPPTGWTKYARTGTPTTSLQTANPPVAGSTYVYIYQATVLNTAGGLRQTITGLTSGASYNISGYYKTIHSDITVSVKCDTNGGTDYASAEALVASRSGSDTTNWYTFNANVTATGTSMTIFLDVSQSGGTKLNHVGAFDNVSVVANAPVVTNVTNTTTSGTYKAGGVTGNFTIAFSASVTVTGTPRLQLDVGKAASNPYVSYASGSPGTTLTFSAYTVTAGDTASDLCYYGTGALGLNGGTINATSGGAAATLTLPACGNTGSLSANCAIVIDTTAPSVTSINRKTPANQTTNATSVVWTVTFNESVSNVDTSDFQITKVSGTISGYSVTTVSAASGTSMDVTVSTGSGDGEIRLDLKSGTNVTDAAGNVANAYTSGQTYLVDKTAPSVTINQAGGQADPATVSPINFTVVFSESTTNFATGDVTLSGTAGATTGIVTGSGTTYNVAVSGMTANGTVIATITAGKATDAAGNGNTASTSTDNTVTWAGACTTPNAPTAGSAVANSTTQITWGWTRASGATGELYRGYDAQGTPVLKWTSAAEASSHAEVGLSGANVLYGTGAAAANQRNLKTYTCAESSALALPARYTLQIAPSAVTYSSYLTDGTGFTVNTTGPANLGTTAKVTFNNGGTDRTPVSALSEAITGLTANTQYTFKAKANNAENAFAGGADHSGTYTGTISRSQTDAWGSDNGAVRMTASVANYIDIGGANNNFADLTGGLTIELWANPTSVAGCAFVSLCNTLDSSTDVVDFITSAGTPGILQCNYRNNTTQNAVYTPTAIVTVESWQHLAVTIDAAGVCNLYYNGTAQTVNRTYAQQTLRNVSRTVNGIGQTFSNLNFTYGGAIDEVAIYNYALSATRLAAHYGAASASAYNAAVRADSPIAYWRLSESSGTTAYGSHYYSEPTSTYTLSVAPTAGSVTPDDSSPCLNTAVTWTAVGGFGAGKIQYYRYAWDQTATHTWTDTETQWSGGTISTTPTVAGTWYLHVKGYNGSGVGNGTYDYSVTTQASPDMPTKAPATDVGTDSITWHWTDVANETGYEVWDSASGGSKRATLGADVTSYTETDLDPGTTYTRWVAATGCGGSARAALDAVTTAARSCAENAGYEQTPFQANGAGSHWIKYVYSGKSVTCSDGGAGDANNGSHAQKVARGSGSGDLGGVYQKVNVVSGQAYRVWGYMKVTTSLVAGIGADWAGGTDPAAASWDMTGSSTYVFQSVLNTATADKITIFAKLVGSVSGYACFDDISVAPGPVTNGTPEVLGTGSIRWKWTDIGNESGYRLRDTSGLQIGADIAQNATQLDEAGLAPNTSYTRRVHPFLNCGAELTCLGGNYVNQDPADQSACTFIETPTGVSFGTVTETSIVATPSGTLSNLGSGSSGVRVANVTAATDSGWKQDTSGYTSSGLTANAEYTFVARARNADGVETGDCSPVAAWTLSVAPTTGSVTPDKANPCTGEDVRWTAVGGFGAGRIAKYKFAWDQNATHTWDESETDWSAGDLTVTPTSAGDWYLHIKGYNGAGVANGTYDYTLTVKAATQIASHPVDANLVGGATATFTAAGSGDGTVTYQWQRYNGSAWDDLSDGGKVSGATTATLQIANVADEEEGQYRCLVTAGCGDVSSNAAELTVAPQAIVWASVKTHLNSVGEKAILLDPAKAGTGPSAGWAPGTYGEDDPGDPGDGAVTECRRGGLTKLLVQFDRPVRAIAGDGTPSTADVQVKDAADSPQTPASVAFQGGGASGTVLEITLGTPPAGDPAQRYTIKLMNASDQNTFRRPSSEKAVLAGARQCVVRYLVGDTNSDGVVNLSDSGQVKTYNHVAVDDSSARYDVNLDGKLNLIDLALTKSKNGTKAPQEP